MLYFDLGRTLSNVVRTCGQTHLLYDDLAIKIYLKPKVTLQHIFLYALLTFAG